MRQLLVFVSIVACALAGDLILGPDLGNYWVLQEPDGKLSMFRWDEAMQQCYNKGGHLVVINSQIEADVLADIMKIYKLDNAFVGFSDLMAEGYFLTLRDETLKEAGYSAWANGYPNGGRTSNCGAINNKGKLMDISCHQILPAICEKENWDAGTYAIKKFKYHEEELNWADAMERCQQGGGNLVVPNSPWEMKVVTQLLKASNVVLGHVGIHSRYSVPAFFSVYGEVRLTGYEKVTKNKSWSPSDRERTAVAIDILGQYHTVYDETKLSFVCEYPTYAH